MESLIENIISFVKSLLNGITALVDLINNLGSFILSTINGLLEGVTYLLSATSYVTGFSSAVPSAVYAMFATMVSLSLVFFIIGRVK